jgi:hypothetical protein
MNPSSLLLALITLLSVIAPTWILENDIAPISFEGLLFPLPLCGLVLY